MWHVYIIQGKDARLYTGITIDVQRRLAEHNSGHGGRFTRFRGPFELCYIEDLFSRADALKREAEIKKLSRSEKLKLIRSFGLSHKVEASGRFLANARNRSKLGRQICEADLILRKRLTGAFEGPYEFG